MTYRHHRFPVLWAEEAVGGQACTNTGHSERRPEEPLWKEGSFWRARTRTPVPSEALCPLLGPAETHSPGKRHMPRSANGAKDAVGATHELSHGLRSLASASPRDEY